MSRQITGTVTYASAPQLCTVRVVNFFGKSNIDVEIYDLNNNAQVGDFIIARELTIPVKGKSWRVTQIVERAKTSTINTT